MEAILNSIYKASTYIILCGDFNINHLEASKRNSQLQALLASFNFFSTVTIPTRTAMNSSNLIDNIYLDTDSCNYMVYPLICSQKVFEFVSHIRVILTDVLNTCLENTTNSHVCFQDVGRYFKTVKVYA